mmetsp:Transcript_29360/g.65727  ORF Transcript_29360/g.65727 Transcript_29360/m.65727 type:complete len:404 (+) Transcript_29360:62-1273(+)
MRRRPTRDMENQPYTPPNPALEWYKEWSGRTPLVTRYILQTLGVLYLLSWATSSLTLGLINIPYSTILKFQLYRLFLAPLVGNSLLSLVFAAIWLSSMGAKVENAFGSAKFASVILMVGTFANAGFAIFCFLMAALGTYEALFFTCQGFWVVLLGLIAVESLESGVPTRQLFMIPYQIPTKYYPLALYGLFFAFGRPRPRHGLRPRPRLRVRLRPFGLRHAVRRAGREHGTRRLPRQARATAGLHCPGFGAGNECLGWRVVSVRSGRRNRRSRRNRRNRSRAIACQCRGPEPPTPGGVLSRERPIALLGLFGLWRWGRCEEARRGERTGGAPQSPRKKGALRAPPLGATLDFACGPGRRRCVWSPRLLTKAGGGLREVARHRPCESSLFPPLPLACCTRPLLQ